MYRSLLITRVDDSVSAVTLPDDGLAGFAGCTGWAPHLSEYRAHSFEEANVLRKRTKPVVSSSLCSMTCFL